MRAGGLEGYMRNYRPFLITKQFVFVFALLVRVADHRVSWERLRFMIIRLYLSFIFYWTFLYRLRYSTAFDLKVWFIKVGRWIIIFLSHFFMWLRFAFSSVADPWHFGTVRIRIHRSLPLTNGFGSGSCCFHQWPLRRQLKSIFSLIRYRYGTFWRYIYINFQR